MVCIITSIFPAAAPLTVYRLLKTGQSAQAMAVISALDDKPMTDPGVQQTFHAIKEAVALEEGTVTEKGQPKGKASLRELFSGGRSQNFRRVALGVVIQCFQQVNPSPNLVRKKVNLVLIDHRY